MTGTRGLALLMSGASVATLALVLGTGAAVAGVLPGHGHFAEGSGSIAKSRGGMTVDQSSRTGIVDWKSFSIGKNSSVLFNNRGGATLNIVRGGSLSRISGSLQSNGSVYLINRAGLVITGSGRIDTSGSFMASGRNADSLADVRRLTLSGHNKGTIVNSGAITSGGHVGLFGDTVSSSGSIAARSADVIASQRATVTGRIAAAGKVETSGRTLRIDGAGVSAQTWLIDPKTLNVGAGAATSISSSLNGGSNVTLKTTASGCSGPGSCAAGTGNINIGAPIVWTTGTMLTLNAFNDVNINDSIHAKGTGGLTIMTGPHGDLFFGSSGSASFDHHTSTLIINHSGYRLVSNLTTLANVIATDPYGSYALSHNINAASDGVYASSPVTTDFYGTFEGLGHSISNLTIKDPSGTYVGLFSDVEYVGVLRDLHLINANVYGLANSAYVGGLAGDSSGVIQGVTVSGHVVGGYSSDVGGLVGYTDGQDGGFITNSSSSALVQGSESTDIGGLVGYGEYVVIQNSSASGNVEGVDGDIGGLIGYLDYGNITKSHATGEVKGDDSAYVGGLAGYIYQDAVLDSYATGNVFGGYDSYVGGLVGYNEDYSQIDGSHATGNVTADGYSEMGGLVGYADYGGVTNSYATGNVIGGYSDTYYIGGLVGYDKYGTYQNVHATGNVSGDYEAYVGGLIGYKGYGSVNKAYATGDVSTGYDGDGGGLIGYVSNNMSITNSYATGNVTGGYESSVGGLVGYYDDSDSVLQNVHATGNVIVGYDGDAGGLVGYGDYTTTNNAYATGDVSGGSESYVGGLYGYSSGDPISNSYATGNVTGGYDTYTGGLVGESSDSTIVNSYATGKVHAGDDSYVGGLIGDSGSYGLNHVYATGAVYGGYDNTAGGLIGYNSSPVTASYATGRVTTGGDSYTGGLIGEMLTGSALNRVYATGEVNGGYDTDAGGLVGYISSGTIDKAFATGAVTGEDGDYGGLVGYNSSGNDITDTYATGTVVGGESSYVGGLVGYNAGAIATSYSTGYVAGDAGYVGGFVGDDAAGTYTHDYWDKTTSGTTSAGGGGAVTGVTGRTTTQLKAGLPGGFDPNIWAEDSQVNGGLPYLIGVPPP